MASLGMIQISTWREIWGGNIVARMLPFRYTTEGNLIHVFAFDGPTAVLHTSLRSGPVEDLTPDEVADLAEFNEWKHFANIGFNTTIPGFSVPWHGVKSIASEHGLIPSIAWVECMGLITVWVTHKGQTFIAQIPAESSDADDFRANFLPRIRPVVDCDGKPYIRIYSGDPAWQTVAYTARGDNLETGGIGTAEKLEWDAAQAEGARAFGAAVEGFQEKSFAVRFTEPIRILRGSAFWTGGDLDCTMQTHLVFPEGAIYGFDAEGNPLIAPCDIPIYHHVNDQSFLGDCPGGLAIFAESSSDPVPVGAEMRITIRKKAANVAWAGMLRLDVYRITTVN